MDRNPVEKFGLAVGDLWITSSVRFARDDRTTYSQGIRFFPHAITP
jgi:hypothetical protein